MQKPGPLGSRVGKERSGDLLKPAPQRNLVQRQPDQTVAAVIALLAEKWPRAFSVFEKNRKPLKLNIHLDIMKEMEGTITPIELSVAMKCYVANKFYLKRCRKVGAPRFNLAGEPEGVISESEADYAKLTLFLGQQSRG
jgi:sRNA-binding protein